jgi:hypothetical protein
MFRRAYAILAVFSLILALSFAGLWVWSYWWDDLVVWPRFTSFADKSDFFAARSCRGTVGLVWGSRDWSMRARAPRGGSWAFGGFGLRRNALELPPNESHHLRVIPPDPDWPHGGDFVGGLRSCSTFWMPHWALALVGLPLPIAWIWGRRRHEARALRGLCLTCGYDLRAHRPGEKCPECGTPVAAAQTSNPVGKHV